LKNTHKTSDGKKGGLFVGKSHAKGGIPAIVVDTGQPIEVEGGEAIINKEATKKYWKQLSSINQSAGNGNPIPPPTNLSDNPDEYAKGGKISRIAIMQGTKHELEHSKTIKSFAKTGTSVKEIARKIAIDHLRENPNYYKILTKLKLAKGGEVVCRSCSNSWSKHHKDVNMNVFDCEKCGNNNQKFYKGGVSPDMSTSEIKAFYDSPEGKKLDAETHAEWKRLVNMSKSELQAFYDSEEGKTAGLSKAKADELGISNGRTSARWILKMKDIPYTEWTSQMWIWAKKQISFIKRMSKNRGALYEPNGKKTRKYLSLLIWGHDPEKYANGGRITDKNRNGNCYEIAGKIAMSNPIDLIKMQVPDFKGKPYLVHAQVIGQGEIEGVKYGHAWIEDDLFVYDFSNGRKIVFPKELYYILGGVEKRKPKYFKYTFEEAQKLMVKTGHYGSWELITESGL
jgi:hypothetical protein